MEKRKIKTRVLAFVSTFIILLTMLSTIVFAQAPNFDNYTEYTVTTTIFDTRTNNILAYVIFNGDNSGSWIVNISINSVIFSDYFYNNYYSGIFENDIDFLLDLPVNSRFVIVHNVSSGSQNFARVSDYSNDIYIDCLYDFGQFNGLSFSNYDYFYNAFEFAYENQFTYWENQLNILEGEKQVAFDNGFAEGQQAGLQTGYNEGLTVGYTNAINDFDMFTEGLFEIFNAPFVFVQNISTFEIFGIDLFSIIGAILVLSIGFLLIKFIGGAIPL